MVIAALYVDPKGPYQGMDGVECWDEERDARGYAGPYPAVAHPPCGPWGRLHHLCTKQDRSLGPLAVEQVQRWGGVLEHPADSKLWRHCKLPFPGELPDEYGGTTLAIDQCDWGHVCRKPTWLYMVGARAWPDRQPKEPTAKIFSGLRKRDGLRWATKSERRLTPRALAEWLATIARTAGAA